MRRPFSIGVFFGVLLASCEPSAVDVALTLQATVVDKNDARVAGQPVEFGAFVERNGGIDSASRFRVERVTGAGGVAVAANNFRLDRDGERLFMTMWLAEPETPMEPIDYFDAYLDYDSARADGDSCTRRVAAVLRLP